MIGVFIAYNNESACADSVKEKSHEHWGCFITLTKAYQNYGAGILYSRKVVLTKVNQLIFNTNLNYTNLGIKKPHDIVRLLFMKSAFRCRNRFRSGKHLGQISLHQVFVE